MGVASHHDHISTGHEVYRDTQSEGEITRERALFCQAMDAFWSTTEVQSQASQVTE